jgi:ubiquinone/menaquinone biosynthesis C-methylase UbiE
MTLLRDPEEVETRYLHSLLDLAGRRVLEIGCGDGRLTWRYALAVGYVVGIDLNPISLLKAQQECQPDLCSKVTFALANSLALPFPPKLFDVAVLAWSL